MFYGKEKVDTINPNNLNYNKFKSILNDLYTKKVSGSITYYLNELNQVVAREEDNVLNLYFINIDKLNNNIPVSMIIIKDFVLKMGIISHKKSDVLITGGLEYDAFYPGFLNRGYNIFSHSNRMQVTTSNDDYLTINPDEILNVINSLDYYCKEEMEIILSKLHMIKEKLKVAEKMQIGGISTIERNIDPNDKHLCAFNIPGYSLELHNSVIFNDQPCKPLGQSYYVLNEEIKPTSDAVITNNHFKHHNYAKLFKPTIKRTSI